MSMQPPEEYASLRIRTPPPDEEYEEKMKRTTQSFHKKCAERKELCIDIALLVTPLIIFLGLLHIAGIYS
jgi:hypothetical protein